MFEDGAIALEEHQNRGALMLNALNSVLDIFSFYNHAQGSVEDILSDSIGPVADAATIDQLSIFRMLESEAGRRLTPVYRWTRAGGAAPLYDHVYAAPGHPVIEQWISALMADESAFLTASELAGMGYDISVEFGFKSKLSIPIFSRGKLWGAVNFDDNSSEHRFDDETIKFLRSAARLFTQLLIRVDTVREAEEAFAVYKRDSERQSSILKTLLDGLDAMILATVPETGEILYINDQCRNFFDVGEYAVGQICYEYIHGRTERCEGCPYLQLLQSPSTVVSTDAYYADKDITHRLTTMLLDWPGGHKAQIDFGVDITESVRQKNTLEKMLNSLDAIILATVPDTGEILFLNDYNKRFYGVEGKDGLGKPCYEFLHGRKERCDYCPYYELEEEPERVVKWTLNDPHIDRVHSMTAMMIDWPGGQKAHLEFGVDITEGARAQETLEKILDTLATPVYVTDLQTDEILYVNESMKAAFNVGDEIKGDKCWRHMQEAQTARCDFCPKPGLLENPGQSVVWEDDNPLSKSVFHHIDRIIDWPGSRKVHMQQSIDITDSRNAQAAVEQRGRMLNALNNMAIALIMRRGEELEDVVTQGVRIITEAMGVDRISISRNTEKPDGLYATQVYRWTEEKGSSLVAVPELYDNPYSRQIPRWQGVLSAGECVNGPLSLMPEYEALKHFGCATILAVPVFSEEVFWGFALYEDRKKERAFTFDEIEILRSASLMLVNVFIRDEEAALIRQASEHAKLMLDATPLGCTLWMPGYRIADCNDALVTLFGLNSKEEWADKIFDCMPEFQPNGKPSKAFTYEMLDKAEHDGYCVVEFVHQALDGTPIPSEVTLVRIQYGKSSVVAAYIRDLREQKRMLGEIEKRSRLLRAENALSAILLQTNPERFDSDIIRSMGLLADAAKTDRVYVWENSIIEGRQYCKEIYEWSEGAEPQHKHLSAEQPFREVVPGWEKLIRGKCVNGLVRDMHEKYRAALDPQGILAMLLVPIFIKNRLWGFIGFDDCHKERVFTANEEMILRSASNLIANALIRNDEAAAVRQANEYIKLMLDSSPLGCMLWSSDNRAIDCNEAFCKMFGYDNSAQVLPRALECSTEYQPDGRPSSEKLSELLQKTAAEGRCITQWLHQTRDGTPVPVEATFIRINMGNDYVVVTYSRDLREYNRMMDEIDRQTKLLYAVNSMSTRLLQSDQGSFEPDLKSALGVLAEAVAVDRVYVWKNRTDENQIFGSQIYGWSKAGETMPRDKLVFPGTLEYHFSHFPKMFTDNICVNCIVSEMSPYVQEFLASQEVLSLLWVPIYFKGVPWGFIGFDDCHSERLFTKEEESILRSAAELIADVLFRNEMEENLRESAAKLQIALTEAQSASRAKSEFLSRMSHEMRTPMNAIVGMTAIAQGTQDAAKKDACLDKIGGASKHLLSVINDVLDMSKIEASKFELAVQAFNFERMLINITDVVNFRLDEKKLRFHVAIDKEIPPSMIGDEFRLTQIITNLLSNAIKFTPESGKVTLNAKCLNHDAFSCDILIEVIDTGIGISQEQQGRLFAAFEQADGGTARRFGGTGLGLAISKHLVELMGGRIWIESELGLGAKFAFTVKLQKTGEPVVLPQIDRDSIEILAVDDTPEILEYFADVMHRFGFRCGVASSGPQALEMIQTKEGSPYNIFFVDWLMPDMDGIELARRIKAITSENSVIIMISGAEWSRIAEDGKKAGVDRFISKPLFPSTLLNIIEDCTRSERRVSKAASPGLPDNFAGRRILVAEDMEINQEIISAVLEDTAIEIDFASNGLEAVRKFTAFHKKYSMILMDVQMPELDGYDATRRIRALPYPEAHTVPIVAMTANVFKEDVEACLSAGMDDHVGKPIDVGVLLEKLRKYM